MPLINCPECNREISDKALACPQCGYTTRTATALSKAPKKIIVQKAPTQYGCGTVILVIIVFSIFYNLINSDNPEPPAQPSTLEPQVAAPDAALQAERKAFIDKALREGIFYKIEVPAELPHLWVQPRFLNGDYDTKRKLASVVYAYYFAMNPKHDILVIKDSRTGKRIGTYSASGLDLK